MAKRDKTTESFWFKFYPDNYLGGTAGFTFEMHGAYWIMLLHQNANGPFEESTAIATVGDLWTKIRHKFIKLNDGRFLNVRMEKESQHRKEISEINTNNIRKRYDRTTTVVRTTLLYSSSGIDTLNPSNLDTSTTREINNSTVLEDELPIQTMAEEKSAPIEKPSKPKNGIDLSLFPELPDVLKAPLVDWIDHRRSIKKPVTQKAVKLGIEKLLKLSDRDTDKAIDIIENSILNGWAGFFPIKDKK